MEPFIAEIIMFAGNYAPRGWAFCDGALLPINQYQALFSLVGTTYGGDGRTTFGLPDLRGRAPVGMGTGPGLSEARQGQARGVETRTLTTAEMPAHSHPLEMIGVAEEVPLLGQEWVGTVGEPTVTPQATGQTGGGQPVDVRSPFLAVNYIIALEGIFPSRS